MFNTLVEIQQALIGKEVTIHDLCYYYLNQIEANQHLNAFIKVYRDDVVRYCESIQSKLDNDPGSLGALFGCIVSLKDNICYAGHPSQGGSKILDGFVSPYSATAVERLIKADAFIIGSTNCDEFGMGSASENPHFGPVRNGLDNNKIAGGSSGGSAVSVQCGMCLAAIGSDTGGSVRQPAAFTQTIGYKPTYGHISRHGLMAYGSSFDQIGVIAHDLDTITKISKVIRGEDQYDATCRVADAPPADNKKIAILKGTLEGQGQMGSDFKRLIDRIKNKGFEVSEVTISLFDKLVPTYYILTSAEASTNLGRFDGVRYGYRSKDSDTLESMYVNSRSKGFGPEVKKRIMMGTFVLSEGYYDAYYTKAQKIRRLIKDEVEGILLHHRYLLCPTTLTPPWNVGQSPDDPTAVYKSDIYTVLPNICGLPAVSIPLKGEENTSPYSAYQVISGKNTDLKLLEEATLA